MIPEDSKKLIDGLPEDELRYEINLGRRSRFQREKFAYLKTRLAELEATKMQHIQIHAETGNSSWIARHTGSLIVAIATVAAALIGGIFLIISQRPQQPNGVETKVVEQRRIILESYVGAHFIIGENEGEYSLRHRDTPQPKTGNLQWQIKSVGKDAITIANDPTPYSNIPDDRKEKVIKINDILTFIGKNETHW